MLVDGSLYITAGEKERKVYWTKAGAALHVVNNIFKAFAISCTSILLSITRKLRKQHEKHPDIGARTS